jgi:hypothetical protein
MGISFGVATLSGVIESSMLMTSATSGPLLGVFVLAMLFPCVNWKVQSLPAKCLMVVSRNAFLEHTESPHKTAT